MPRFTRPRRRALLALAALVGGAVSVVSLPASAYTPTGSAASYKFLTADNPPGQWDPCTPIKFMVNEGGKAGAANDAREALWRVGHANGLVFEYQGTTSFVPTAAQPAPAGTHLVVAWVRHDQTDAWQGNATAAYAQPSWDWGYKADGTRVLRMTKGYILANSQLSIPAGFHGPQYTRGEMIMHEAGHIVGLAHVNDSTQLMNSIGTPLNGRWGAGDMTGLNRLGAKTGCIYPSTTAASANQGSVPAQPADPFPATHYNNDPTPTGAATTPTTAPSPTPTASAPSGSLRSGSVTLRAHRFAIRRYAFRGTALPAEEGQKVTIYRSTPTGWVAVATDTTNSSGAFLAYSKLPLRGGQVSFVARSERTSTTAEALSPTQVIRVH